MKSRIKGIGSKKYPTEEFKGKTDVSPIAINDKEGLEKIRARERK